MQATKAPFCAEVFDLDVFHGKSCCTGLAMKAELGILIRDPFLFKPLLYEGPFRSNPVLISCRDLTLHKDLFRRDLECSGL